MILPLSCTGSLSTPGKYTSFTTGLADVTVSRYSIMNLGLKPNLLGHCYWPSWLSGWQDVQIASRRIALEIVLPCFPTWKVTLFAGHDPARVNNVEDDQCNKHRQSVKDILVRFMIWDSTVEALRVLDEAENYSYLQQRQHPIPVDRPLPSGITHGDKDKDRVFCVKQYKGLRQFVRILLFDLLVEPESNVQEYKDEKLLKSNTTHVNVKS